MPLQRRLPKFGFTNLKRVEFKAINLSTLEELAAKKSLAEITVDTLIAAGFISSKDKVKILGNGTVTKLMEDLKELPVRDKVAVMQEQQEQEEVEAKD